MAGEGLRSYDIGIIGYVLGVLIGNGKCNGNYFNGLQRDCRVNIGRLGIRIRLKASSKGTQVARGVLRHGIPLERFGVQGLPEAPVL